MDIEQEVENIRSELEKYALPIIRLEASVGEAEFLWSSKFGGKPYWPKDKEYPTTTSDSDLVLIAQLNFEELPHLDGFPQQGLLQFFIADDGNLGKSYERSLEKILEKQKGYRVIYHPNIEKNTELLAKNLPQVGEGRDLPLSSEHIITAQLDTDIAPPVDFRYEKYVGDPYEQDDELGDYIYDLFEEEWKDETKIGGYATFGQHDPRVLGEHDDWVLLFQMDSSKGHQGEVKWRDMGSGKFFIEQKALLNLDFSRVWYHWDF